MGLLPLEIVLLLLCGDRLWQSESNVYRRQIMTSKVDPRAVRVTFQVITHLKLCLADAIHNFK